MARRVERSTSDLLILLIAGTICAAILLTLILFGVLELVRPGTDISSGAAAITGVINTLVGLLAGYLTGRTQRLAQRKPGTDDDA